MESISADDARRSLDSIVASRQDVADRLTTPPWYYPVLGLLIAQMVLVHGLVGDRPAVLSALLVVLGSGWLVRTYAGHTGLRISRPSGRRSAAALAAFAVGLATPVLVVTLVDDIATGTVLALAAVSLFSTVVLGPVYDATYRADLRRRSDVAPA
ncbi:hypothetical protein [Nocardioides sp. P5_C9_2]